MMCNHVKSNSRKFIFNSVVAVQLYKIDDRSVVSRLSDTNDSTGKAASCVARGQAVIKTSLA